MSLFERFLSVWVLLCIVAGLILGSAMPGLFGVLAGLEYASVNIVVAVLIWAVTAPGMTAYATGKSEWAARITSDGFGLEPTIHYAAMFAEAFFESDVTHLIDAGTAMTRVPQVPEDLDALVPAIDTA